MALVQTTPSARSQDLALVALVFVVFGIIAAAVPCLKVAIDQCFGLF